MSKELTNQDIEHVWDCYVGDPTRAHPLEDNDKHVFARAIIAKYEALRPAHSADMYWNDDDAEIGHTSIDALLDSVWCDGLLEVGAEFTVQQASALPKIKVRVTEIDEENGLKYEVIGPVDTVVAVQA